MKLNAQGSHLKGTGDANGGLLEFIWQRDVWQQSLAHSACQTFCHLQRRSPKITVSCLHGSFEGSTPEAALLTFHNGVWKHQKTPTTALGVCIWEKKMLVSLGIHSVYFRIAGWRVLFQGSACVSFSLEHVQKIWFCSSLPQRTTN